MSKAVIIPFFHFNGTSKETSRSLFTYFLKHLKTWRDEVDTVYIIDSGDFIPETEGITIIKKPRQSHWQNLNEVMNTIKEDKFIIMDSDTIVYKEDVVAEIFKDLDRYHIVSILDSSGDLNHKPLEENEYRGKRNRLCPYLFGCQTSYFRMIDFDFTPQPAEGYVDSMSEITDKLFSLRPKFKELPDDRWTLYYNNGDFNWFNFSMDESKKWYTKQDLGYYHLRNTGGALFMCESFLKQNEAWDKIVEITPKDELIRLLSWAEVVTGSKISFVPDDYRNKLKEKYTWIN